MKIHLIISADPISSGKELEAFCLEKIPMAEAIPLTELPEEPKSTITFCKRCFARKYFYAISGGQEKHDMDSGD